MLWAGLAGPASACGAAAAACATATGDYLLRLPGGGPVRGTVLFLHGHGGSAAQMMADPALAAPLASRGYALAAAEGMPRQGGAGHGWAFRGGGARDDAAYLAEVMEDLAARHGLPRGNILLAGFSSGGFMTSYLACSDPQAARGFAPVAGGFWRPLPADCAGPVRLLHVHGWSDGVVPLEGRRLGSGAMQGDIFAGMEIWRRANRCAAMAPGEVSAQDGLWRRSWRDCAPEAALDLVLHPGGHVLPPGWAALALDWFEALP
nr:polyhydroxybutyrate depolymerase [Mangrovicoccus algicola]